MYFIFSFFEEIKWVIARLILVALYRYINCQDKLIVLF